MLAAKHYWTSIQVITGYGRTRISKIAKRLKAAAQMLKPRKYSLGALLDNFWLAVTLVAIWGTVLTIIGAILFW
jgi:hypothetical protein